MTLDPVTFDPVSPPLSGRAFPSSASCRASIAATLRSMAPSAARTSRAWLISPSDANWLLINR